MVTAVLRFHFLRQRAPALNSAEYAQSPVKSLIMSEAMLR
jgi:hypothetical protein